MTFHCPHHGEVAPTSTLTCSVCGRPMDLFDAVTEDAVRDYAERHGLDFDAIIGDASRNFVGELATKLPAATPDEIEALVDAEMKMDDLPARLAAGLQEAHAETE